MEKTKKVNKNVSDNDEIQGKNEDSRADLLEGQLKQALSDYQNLKRTMEKRLNLETDLTKAEVLGQLIELADDIDLAIDHIEDEKGWREGVGQILEKFRVVIENLGGEVIPAKPGDKFDAEVHEAIGVSESGKNGEISDVIQNGYKLGHVVVRPARVIVNKINNK